MTVLTRGGVSERVSERVSEPHPDEWAPCRSEGADNATSANATSMTTVRAAAAATIATVAKVGQSMCMAEPPSGGYVGSGGRRWYVVDVERVHRIAAGGGIEPGAHCDPADRDDDDPAGSRAG